TRGRASRDPALPDPLRYWPGCFRWRRGPRERLPPLLSPAHPSARQNPLPAHPAVKVRSTALPAPERTLPEPSPWQDSPALPATALCPWSAWLRLEQLALDTAADR